MAHDHKVGGSIPSVSRGSSSGAERMFCIHEAGGSNPPYSRGHSVMVSTPVRGTGGQGSIPCVLISAFG